MRLYAEIQFDKPIDPDGPFPSVGGFEVVTEHDGNRHVLTFDFLDAEYTVEDDPRILSVACRDADEESFPSIPYLCRHLHEITKLTEAYVDMEAYDGETEPDAVPEPLACLSFAIESYAYDGMHDTSSVKIERTGDIACFSLSDDAIRNCTLV